MSKHYDTKQVILVRRDLRNAQGQKVKSAKLGVQIAHASMIWLGERFRDAPKADEVTWNRFEVDLSEAEANWLVNGSFAKICLGVDSEEELRSLVDKARLAGLTAEIVTDAGHTEFGGVPTVTCAGIGPDEASRVDAITGHLKPL